MTYNGQHQHGATRPDIAGAFEDSHSSAKRIQCMTNRAVRAQLQRFKDALVLHGSSADKLCWLQCMA
jgi:hypothetical protein